MAEERMIIFTKDYEVKDDEHKQYKADSKHTMPIASCHHFVNRKVAKFIGKGSKPVKGNGNKEGKDGKGDKAGKDK